MAKERHTVAFLLGAALGGAAGAVYGLLHAPRPGEVTIAELTERWHEIEDRAAEEVAVVESEVRERVEALRPETGDSRHLNAE
jgi:gas vesicle protein